MKGTNNFAKNIFLAQFEIVLNFHYFCKVRACRISVKNSDFQKVPKIVEKHFFWWKEQIILPKNIFLAQFEIVLNFHYFCKVRACQIPSKVQISKNCLKLWRNTSFDERNKQFMPKNIFLIQFEIVLNFHYFCKGPRLSNFRQKFNFPKIA